MTPSYLNGDSYSGSGLYRAGPLFGGGGMGNQIANARTSMRDEALRGTQSASDLLRSGYESQFRARAQGAVGGFGEMSSRLGAQGAQQGLSPDVLQRLLYAPGMDLQSQLGAMKGEGESELDMQLAELMKGTSSELMGIDRDSLSMFLNKEAAKRARKDAQNAGWVAGFGTLGSAVATGMTAGAAGPAMGAASAGGGGFNPYAQSRQPDEW